MPVEADPAALPAGLPAPEPEFPVLPPPRVPSVPGPAPVKPGTDGTVLCAAAALFVPEGFALG